MFFHAKQFFDSLFLFLKNPACYVKDKNKVNVSFSNKEITRIKILPFSSLIHSQVPSLLTVVLYSKRRQIPPPAAASDSDVLVDALLRVRKETDLLRGHYVPPLHQVPPLGVRERAGSVKAVYGFIF